MPLVAKKGRKRASERASEKKREKEREKEGGGEERRNGSDLTTRS